MTAPDLRPVFTDRSAAQVRPGLAMTPVAVSPTLVLDRDALGLLRDGLGRYDMEIRWMVRLDDSNVLRLWRSWTGFQIYEATVVLDEARESAAITALKVERDPERHRGSAASEPGRFESALISSVNRLRQFRAGHTPYGPSQGAGPLPPAWPETQESPR